MESSTSACANCAQPVSSRYCPNCGQPNPPKKLSLLTLWVDFQSRVYGFDGMFPRTLIDLTFRPGQVAREFIQGNRVKHYGPVGYFFLMITVLLLLASLLDVDMYAFREAANPVPAKTSGTQEVQQAMTAWVNDNMRFWSFMVALNIVFFTWLFFKKSGYNFIESSVLIFYVHGHAVWLSILSLINYKITGYAWNSFLLLFIVNVYNVFAFVDLYTYRSKVKIAIRGVLTVISSFVVMLIILISGFIFYLFTHPEFMERIRPSHNS